MDYTDDSNNSSYVDPREHQAEDVQEFLRKMGLIESSGGKNTNHPMMNSGIHAGTHAIGEYGMMPLTAQLVDKKSGVNELEGLSKDELQDRLNNDPEFVNRLAQTMASDMLRKSGTEGAAQRWQQGAGAPIDQETLDTSPRIKKFRALKNLK